MQGESAEIIKQNLIHGEIDDDCQTDEEQL